MTLTLYFLRHGQTNYSRENRFCGSGLDPELTADGKEMAAEFAAYYKTLPWERIYTSSLIRTQMTAKPLCDLIGATAEIRDELSEIAYGEWEGRTVEDVSERFHDDYIRWTADPGWNAPNGGEAAVTIARRALRVIEEVKEEVPKGKVLVVSHKATIRIVLASLVGIDPGRFRYRLACPVGSVSIVDFNREGPYIRQLADRSHLSEQLRNLPGT